MKGMVLMRRCYSAFTGYPKLKHKLHAASTVTRLSDGCRHARSLSITADELKISYDQNSEVATMHLCRKPVNSLNLEFLTAICIALEKLENERSCRGLIITSGLKSVFSAGLDIMEMVRPAPERLEIFWKTLQQMWYQLYTSRLITIAAINGHAPAGGCLLATACDRRIMASNFTIGLNEVKLGIVAPFWLIECMTSVVGYHQAEWSTMKGHLFSSEEAHKIGLVDKVVPQEQVLVQAEEEMKEWLDVSDTARSLTKMLMRKAAADKFQAGRDADLAIFKEHIQKESIQKLLQTYMENLKKK